MTTPDFATLSLLGDSDLTVADGEEDIRGRAVKDRDGTEIGKVDDPHLVTEQKYLGDMPY